MTPLVLVHGFMGGSAQWAMQRVAWEHDFDVIAVDLPGFGENAHLPVIHSIGGFADWVIAELRARGVAQYHLLGHSMGGMIVQEIARRDAAQVQKLVLYGTGPNGVLPGRFETIAKSKERAAADGVSATARRISATWFLDKEQAAHYPDCAALAERSAATALPAGLDAMEAWSGEDLLDQIAAETLVIWGNKDRTYAWAQADALWRGVPNTTLCVVPDCAHAVHLEAVDLFNRVVSDFLRSS